MGLDYTLKSETNYEGLQPPLISGTCNGLQWEILRDKTMADKSMYIPNDETHNYPFKRLKFVVETFEHLT